MVNMDDLEWVENGIGRKVPKVVEGVEISPYCGPFNAVPTKSNKYGPKLGYIADQKSAIRDQHTGFQLRAAIFHGPPSTDQNPPVRTHRGS